MILREANGSGGRLYDPTRCQDEVLGSSNYVMKKLTVLDPGYLYPTGHHHALNALILRKAEAWGCEVTILANKALAEGGFGQRLLSPTIYPHPHTI